MGGTSIEFDTVLELCRDRHRRIALAVLADRQQSLTLNDLTKMIVNHNHHTPPEVSEGVVRQIRLSLHHIHIPKLEAVALIEYDSERHLVEPTDQFEQFQPHLSALIDADPGLEAPVEL